MDTTEATQSDTVGKIGEALAKAQAKMEPAVKDSNNPFFKSKYADLAAVWRACRDQLTSNGIAVVQRVSSNGDGVFVSTQLLHVSGEWLQDKLFLPVKEKTPQGYGSAITYGRRYALSAMAGIAADDDDGNAASFASLAAKPQPKVAASNKEPGEVEKLVIAIEECQSLDDLRGLIPKLQALSKNEAAAVELRHTYVSKQKELSPVGGAV